MASKSIAELLFEADGGLAAIGPLDLLANKIGVESKSRRLRPVAFNVFNDFPVTFHPRMFEFKTSPEHSKTLDLCTKARPKGTDD